MDTPPRDECTLVDGDHRAQARSEADKELLHEQLSNKVNQANRPKVKEGLDIGLLRQESDESFIQLLKASPIEGVELVKGLTNVSFDHVPAAAQEFSGEPIRPRSLAGGCISDE